ncbi:MAG TPA: NUDIX hydrolase [Bryobacteraceae bacterium]|nr:NUDIX hydrolase [Bryobacteraceae bacterium]
MATPDDWTLLAQRIQAISQNGLTYATSPYDVERYSELSRIAAQMMAGPEPPRVALAEELFAAQQEYATPKVDVRAAVFRDGRLLMVRERSDGCWTLPGGWTEVGQSARESVEREVWEESGFTVKAEKLLAIWDIHKHPHPPLPFHAYKLAFRCSLLSGEPTTSTETSEVGFFGEDEIPPLSLTRTVPEQIQFMFRSLREPDAPTYFD